MIIGLAITGVSAVLFFYLGYRDIRHDLMPSPESAYMKYSSPELYILSVLGIFTGLFISFKLKTAFILILILFPVFYILLKILSPYFEFLPPRR